MKKIHILNLSIVLLTSVSFSMESSDLPTDTNTTGYSGLVDPFSETKENRFKNGVIKDGDFSNQCLRGRDFSYSILINVNFTGSDLRETTFEGFEPTNILRIEKDKPPIFLNPSASTALNSINNPNNKLKKLQRQLSEGLKINEEVDDPELKIQLPFLREFSSVQNENLNSEDK